MLTVITPTGERPAAFALCERLMARQDYQGPVRWIVVDDGRTETPLSPPPSRWAQFVLRPEPYWRPGENTQARNLTEALDAAERLKGPQEELRIAVVEDDDWYHPAWLSTLSAALDGAELAGESHARYYNVAVRRGSELGNNFHASLRCSGLKGRGIEALRRALAQFSLAYDFKMWRDAAPTKRLFQTQLTVGMKGLPGRPGIAAGHRDAGGRRDGDLSLLRRWIGDDAGLYAEFRNEEAMKETTKTVYATGRLQKYKTRRLVAGDAFDVTPQEARAFEKLKFATLTPPSAAAAAPPTREAEPVKPQTVELEPVEPQTVELEPVEPQPVEPAAEDDQSTDEEQPRKGRKPRRPEA